MAGAIGLAGTLIGVWSAYDTGKSAKEDKDDAADLAIREAEEAAKKQLQETEQILSTQQAAYASGGVSLEGTPLFVIEETNRKAAEERELILELGGYRSSALRNQGASLYTQGLGKAAGSFLTGTGKWLEN